MDVILSSIGGSKRAGEVVKEPQLLDPTYGEIRTIPELKQALLFQIDSDLLQHQRTTKMSDMRAVLNRYTGDDWRAAVEFSDVKYNRISVASCPEFDIFVICWKHGQKSRIHDHPENGCLLRVMQGTLEEQTFFNSNGTLRFLQQARLTAGQMGYKEAKTVLHNVGAPVEDAVSLHIYAPGGYATQYYDLPA